MYINFVNFQYLKSINDKKNQEITKKTIYLNKNLIKDYSKAICNINLQMPENFSNFNPEKLFKNLNSSKNNNINIKNNLINNNDNNKIYESDADQNNKININEIKIDNNLNNDLNKNKYFKEKSDNLINQLKKPNKTRNKKPELKYQSSDELIKIAINKEKKSNGKINENYYTNTHFRSEIPKFAEHLPKSIYHVYQFNNKNIDKNCIICLENFIIGQEILTLPCFHFFHCNCISKWLLKKKLCPICHSNI